MALTQGGILGVGHRAEDRDAHDGGVRIFVLITTYTATHMSL